MANKKPLVYVLILNFRSLDDTLECIESAQHSDYPNYKILVIDNDSPDDSGKALQASLPHQNFLQLDKNFGYAEGNNAGIRIALKNHAEYVFILNPDIRLSTNTISSCVSAAQADHAIAAINPVQICDPEHTIDSKFRNTVLLPTGKDITTLCANSLPPVFETSDLLGAALFLTKAALEKVGGFDPLYFAYGEEFDLCRRLRFHHLKLAVVGNAPVLHLRTKESEGPSDHVLFLRLKGTYLEKLKNPRRSFSRSCRLVVQQFVDDILGKRKNEYPFNQYTITRLHSLKVFYWVAINLLKIRQHRAKEKLGRCHV